MFGHFNVAVMMKVVRAAPEKFWAFSLAVSSAYNHRWSDTVKLNQIRYAAVQATG